MYPSVRTFISPRLTTTFSTTICTAFVLCLPTCSNFASSSLFFLPRCYHHHRLSSLRLLKKGRPYGAPWFVGQLASHSPLAFVRRTTTKKVALFANEIRGTRWTARASTNDAARDRKPTLQPELPGIGNSPSSCRIRTERGSAARPCKPRRSICRS